LDILVNWTVLEEESYLAHPYLDCTRQYNLSSIKLEFFTLWVVLLFKRECLPWVCGLLFLSRYFCSILGFFGLTGNLENIISFLLTDLILDRNFQKMTKTLHKESKVFWGILV
jgi:hypothetical protein